ncbi:MFS transporter permease [Microbacterium sp. X-17]|uniref:MFS transporter permease n=1 Tax=Microbacterium sp. X-17 TaxID=3144404 RepID=UPI0031F4A052
MWLRRAFFGWLTPAAFLLPLWLFVGWLLFNAGGWAFLWVLFLAIPSVFGGQLILTLLVRARPSVRSTRAVSWWDVLGFTIWHCLTISLGFYNQAWWAPVFILTMFVGVGMIWLELWQLLREVRSAGRVVLRTTEGVAYTPPPRQAPPPPPDDIIIITEKTPPPE